MTDIFNKMYTAMATDVRAKHSGVYVTGERVPAPTQFPCVMFIEADSYDDPRSVDNSLNENITALMYEVTVFSNKKDGKRSECIAILSDIDTFMKQSNARRIVRVEGYFDTEGKIYMVTARYNVKTDGTKLYTF